MSVTTMTPLRFTGVWGRETTTGLSD
ncbi:hypothetical protein C5167_050363 [Papaver somniferum]|uniref:Uncharacterized protein n=1 Tax=Papaver somniferum TaxID=3469 RepID=A0A4Y7KNG8_PAPSO|nr:hypothetical protein C5167_050363 [Papaver somniferum]